MGKQLAAVQLALDLGKLRQVRGLGLGTALAGLCRKLPRYVVGGPAVAWRRLGLAYLSIFALIVAKSSAKGCNSAASSSISEVSPGLFSVSNSSAS